MKLSHFILTLPIFFLFLSCSNEVTLRSDKPLTIAAASKVLFDFPFPASAHSIYYLFYSGGMQDLEEYVRFDVNPTDLEKSVDGLIAANNKKMKQTLKYPVSQLSAATLVTPRASFLPMAWWDPNTIKKGYYRGEMKAFALNIFVDEARSRIYVYIND